MMKKLFAVIMMLLTILSLTACGSSTDSDEPDIIGMPNPFTDFNTLAGAEKQTGFYITLPDAIGSSNNKIYRAMNDEMLEVIYVNGEDETGRIRKARGSEDISGDYNEYAETETVSVGSITVTLKGDAGQYTLAIWTDGSYSYSLSLSDGLSLSDWQTIMNSIQR